MYSLQNHISTACPLHAIADKILYLPYQLLSYSLQALAAAMAAFFYLWLKRRWTINPDSVYRLALRRLNADPGVLEVCCTR